MYIFREDAMVMCQDRARIVTNLVKNIVGWSRMCFVCWRGILSIVFPEACRQETVQYPDPGCFCKWSELVIVWLSQVPRICWHCLLAFVSRSWQLSPPCCWHEDSLRMKGDAGFRIAERSLLFSGRWNGPLHLKYKFPEFQSHGTFASAFRWRWEPLPGPCIHETSWRTCQQLRHNCCSRGWSSRRRCAGKGSPVWWDLQLAC